MKRTWILTSAVLLSWLGCVSATQAQVFIRAPFVRVAVGDGVAVRAPFVNLYVPPAGPTYYAPFGPPPVYVIPPAPVVQTVPATPIFTPPQPAPVMPQAQDPNAPPQPILVQQATTIEALAKNFQPKAGTFDVTMLNPVTGKATPVRFTLPEGTPRRVIVGRYSIEYVYHLRQWVRIEFDRDGVLVTAR